MYASYLYLFRCSLDSEAWDVLFQRTIVPGCAIAECPTN